MWYQLVASAAVAEYVTHQIIVVLYPGVLVIMLAEELVGFFDSCKVFPKRRILWSSSTSVI